MSEQHPAASPSRWRAIRAANPGTSKRNAKLFAYPRRIKRPPTPNPKAEYRRLNRLKGAPRA